MAPFSTKYVAINHLFEHDFFLNLFLYFMYNMTRRACAQRDLVRNVVCYHNNLKVQQYVFLTSNSNCPTSFRIIVMKAHN